MIKQSNFSITSDRMLNESIINICYFYSTSPYHWNDESVGAVV